MLLVINNDGAGVVFGCYKISKMSYTVGVHQ